jgi:putative glutamine amidotransferase
VTGRSPEDGIAEAVELPGKRFALGVLWHPEEDEASGVIGALVTAAASAPRPVALPQAPG